MARNGGSSIIFGKIQVHSADENLEKLRETLSAVIKKHGYPEEEKEFGDEEEDKSVEDVDEFDESEDILSPEEIDEEVAKLEESPDSSQGNADDEEDSPWIRAMKNKVNNSNN